MSKNMKLLGIASLTVLIVFLATGMVSANGSQNSSSYNGITISVAADVAEGQLTLSGINETGKEVKIMLKKDQLGSIERWFEVSGNYEINSNVIFEDGAGKYFIYAMIKENSNEYSYGPTLYVENIGQVQQVYPGSNVTDEICIENKYYEDNYQDYSYTEDINTKTESDKIESKPIYNETKSISSDGSFINPSKDIDSSDSKVIELSKSLTKGKKTDSQKISAIYNWVAENLTYDFDKYNNMLAGNYSDRFGSLSALETKKGVCYDYSTLMAALCRAEGIQAKVAKGYSVNIIGYHAWNEVFDSERNEWIILDTTVESLNHNRTGTNIEFTVRSSAEYHKTEEM